MTDEIKKPFDGDPPTREYIDEHGNTAFQITPRVLTPGRVKLAEFLAGLSALALMGGGFYGFTQMSDIYPWLWMASLLIPALAFPHLNRFWLSLFHTETEMILTKDEFRVRRWHGWQIFDRTIQHRFVPIDHDKKQKEKDQNEFATRRAQAVGRVIAPKRYYGDSFHVVFEYLGQRKDILTVYGQKDTAEIIRRLNGCDKRLNQLNGMGDEAAIKPDEQWNKGPGDIS